MSVRFPLAEFVADVQVQARLYDLGPYPGLQLGKSDSIVTGELYEIDQNTLRLLDEFEESSNYRRAQFEISLGAEKLQCWTYEPDPSFYSLHKLISSGDWIEYAGAKASADSRDEPTP